MFLTACKNVIADAKKFASAVLMRKFVCCGKQIEALKAVSADDEHAINIFEIEDDFYIELSHEMTKEHYISFVSYVRFDRVLMIKLYPE